MLSFSDDDTVGTVRLIVQSRVDFTDDDFKSASALGGYLADQSAPNRLEFHILGSTDRNTNMNTYRRVLEAIPSVFPNADSVYLGVKKSLKQISVQRCGR